MKKLLSMCLVLIMTLSIFSFTFADEITESNNTNYEINKPTNDLPPVKPIQA